MRSSARPGIACIGYDISALDLLPHFHIEPGVVPEDSLNSVPMADFNHITVSRAETRLNDNTIGWCHHGCSSLSCDIKALMERGYAAERRGAPAERRCDPAPDRPY